VDEPKIEHTESKKGVKFVVVHQGKILYAVNNRKMALRLLEQIKEGKL